MYKYLVHMYNSGFSPHQVTIDMTMKQLKEIQKLSPRDRVIAATLNLITHEGVDAVTHRRVARLAGVSPGTTTHHFAGARRIAA